MVRLVRSPLFGIVAMLGGVAWGAASNSLGWQLLLAGGALQVMLSQFFENVGLKDAAKPKLRLTFDHEAGSPYVRQKPVFHGGNPSLPAGTMEIFSVGVVNDGATAPNVTVRLMKIDPPELAAYWTSALHLVNEPIDESKRDIHPSQIPSAYFEVVQQVSDGGPATSLKVRFARQDLFGKKFSAPLRDKYFLTLAIDGPGAHAPVRYALLRDDQSGHYVMRVAI